jgi:hypothetical protein
MYILCKCSIQQKVRVLGYTHIVSKINIHKQMLLVNAGVIYHVSTQNDQSAVQACDSDEKKQLPDSEKPPLYDDDNNYVALKFPANPVRLPEQQAIDNQAGRNEATVSNNDDWKLVARILDRFFFILFFTANVVSTVCILTHREADTCVACLDSCDLADF